MEKDWNGITQKHYACTPKRENRWIFEAYVSCTCIDKVKDGWTQHPLSVLKAKLVLSDIIEGADGLTGSPNFAVLYSFFDDLDYNIDEDAEKEGQFDMDDAAIEYLWMGASNL